jgi:alpha-ribazole phosphatase
MELDFGEWDEVDWDDVPRDGLDRWAADPYGFAPPGGESGAELIRRVAAVRDALLSDGRAAVVVSHGGPLRLLGPMLRGQQPDLLSPAPPPETLEVIGLGGCRGIAFTKG